MSYLEKGRIIGIAMSGLMTMLKKWICCLMLARDIMSCFFFLNNSIGMSLCNYHLSEEVRSKPHFGIRWGRDCFE